MFFIHILSAFILNWPQYLSFLWDPERISRSWRWVRQCHRSFRCPTFCLMSREHIQITWQLYRIVLGCTHVLLDTTVVPVQKCNMLRYFSSDWQCRIERKPLSPNFWRALALAFAVIRNTPSTSNSALSLKEPTISQIGLSYSNRNSRCNQIEDPSWVRLRHQSTALSTGYPCQFRLISFMNMDISRVIAVAVWFPQILRMTDKSCAY